MRSGLLALAIASLAPLGCAPSAQSDFLGERIPNTCGSVWPVCQTFAGCVLDDSSFTQGTLPGTTKFIVSTLGAATIDISLFLTSAQSEGTLTSLTVFEPGCGVQYLTQVKGNSFFAEGENAAGKPFSRTQEVSLAGDHLIEIDSDATATYLLDVTVTEKENTQ